MSWHNPNIHSPTLEQLASQGILLDSYYVQPTCSPSRAAFMTGQYPYRLGRQHMYIKPLMPSGLPANVKIMPEFFKGKKDLENNFTPNIGMTLLMYSVLSILYFLNEIFPKRLDTTLMQSAREVLTEFRAERFSIF